VNVWLPVMGYGMYITSYTMIEIRSKLSGLKPIGIGFFVLLMMASQPGMASGRSDVSLCSVCDQASAVGTISGYSE